MANSQLTEDLRIEALFRAGEPQDTTSVFWTKALDYLNVIQDTLILGGGVAVGRDLAQSAGIYARLMSPPQTDWWWARKTGALTTKAFVDTTITLSQGSKLTTVSAAVSAANNLTGWRLIMTANGNETAPIVAFHDTNTNLLTLDSEWPEATTTATGRFVKFEYDLPDDFVRFAQRPFLHSGNARSIDVAALEQRDDEFPVTQNFQGEPTRAYMVGPQRIAVNGFDDRGFRLEFEYIFHPTYLQGDDEPILPPTHRRVLSVGAAMLISFDKNDEKMENFASEYRELVAVMHQHQRRAISSGSNRFGQYLTRNPSRRIRSPQPNGELYLT